MASNLFTPFSNKSQVSSVGDCGVYRIVNTRTGDFYIGSTINFKIRKQEHFSDLRCGKHTSKLQTAYDLEADKTVFVFESIIYCSLEERLNIEQMCLDDWKPVYNISLRAVGFLYREEDLIKHSERLKNFYKTSKGNLRREEISRQHRGLKPSDQTKNLMRVSHLGKRKTDIHRENISKAKRGANNPSAKLNEQQVLEIRRSNKDWRILAVNYGVSLETIGDIKYKRSWRYAGEVKSEK